MPRRTAELSPDTVQSILNNTTNTQVFTFTETAGAGGYSAVVRLPLNACVTKFIWRTTAAWDADTAALSVIIDGPTTLYGPADVKAAAATGDFFGAAEGGNYAGQIYAWFKEGQSPSLIISATGAGGTTGRTQILIQYAVLAPTATGKV